MMVHLMLLLVLNSNDRYPTVATNTPIAHPFGRRLLKHELMGELAEIATMSMIKTIASGPTNDPGLIGVDELSAFGTVGTTVCDRTRGAHWLLAHRWLKGR